MKRVLLLGLFLASSTLGLVGCSDTEKATVTEKVQTPTGTKEAETTTKIKTTGDEKPAH